MLQFVKNGVDQGKRRELQGGGLVRSAGGNKAGLLGRKKEERGKGDERILGSGNFVEEILGQSNEIYEIRMRNRISVDELIRKVATNIDVDMDDLKSSKRNRKISYARAVISYLAVNQLGCTASEVARKLGISGMGVGKCVERGKKSLDKSEIIREYLFIILVVDNVPHYPIRKIKLPPGYKASEVGKALEISRKSVSLYIRRAEKSLDNDEEMAQYLK